MPQHNKVLEFLRYNTAVLQNVTIGFRCMPISCDFTIKTSKRSVNKTPIKIDMPDGLFPVIDPDQVSRLLNLETEAAILGEKNLPATDQLSRFGTAEIKIDTEIQRVVTSYHRTAMNKVNHLDAFVDSENTSAYQKIREARFLPNQFNSEVNTYLSNNEMDYQDTKREFETTKKEYEQFKLDNGLTRTANIPTHIEKVYKVVFALFLIAIEVILNCSLFSTNLEGGLLSGIFIAFCASAINIGVASILGYIGIRYINHVTKKAYGYITLAVTCILIVMIGLGVGHFRDALQLNPENRYLPIQQAEAQLQKNEVEQDRSKTQKSHTQAKHDNAQKNTAEKKEPLSPESYAIQTFKNNPLGLADLYSWLLFAITVVFGLAAAKDGYSFDDPYPGYSAIAQKYQLSSQDWADFLEDRRNDIYQIQKRFVEKVFLLLKECDGHFVAINKATQERDGDLSAYDAAIRSANKAYQTLISLFRSENCKYRTEEEPAYFMQEVQLDLSKLPEVPVRNVDMALVQLKNDIEELRNDSQQIQAEIVNAFNEQEAKIRLEKEGLNV